METPLECTKLDGTGVEGPTDTLPGAGREWGLERAKLMCKLVSGDR